jgi:protocatechuate 4,5-dioxygenase alpha chain
MGRLLLPSLAGMCGEGMVEGLPINLLRVFGQMRADGGREIGVGWVGHRLLCGEMCFSFNSAENRAAFLKDEDAYCRKYGLSDEQRAAVKSRSVLNMIEAGGNVYYLAKLAGIFGLNVQDIGAQQTGMSVEAFKSKLLSAGA